jgi:hypothetical protein
MKKKNVLMFNGHGLKAINSNYARVYVFKNSLKSRKSALGEY